MRIAYIADDGTQFDSEIDCLKYEFVLDFPHVKDIRMYTMRDEELTDVFSDVTYGKADKIVVPNENALKGLHKLADFYGFDAYYEISECGKWIWSEEAYIYVKEKSINED